MNFPHFSRDNNNLSVLSFNNVNCLTPSAASTLKYYANSTTMAVGRNFWTFFKFSFGSLLRFWSLMKYWHCQEKAYLLESWRSSGLKWYGTTTCLAKSLEDAVAMCCPGSYSLMAFVNREPLMPLACKPFARLISNFALHYRLVAATPKIVPFAL